MQYFENQVNCTIATLVTYTIAVFMYLHDIHYYSWMHLLNNQI